MVEAETRITQTETKAQRLQKKLTGLRTKLDYLKLDQSMATESRSVQKLNEIRMRQ